MITVVTIFHLSVISSWSECALVNATFHLLTLNGRGLRTDGGGAVEIWKGLQEPRCWGKEVASVEHRQTHNLHGNGLIFLSEAVRPRGAHGDGVDRLC